MRHQQAKAFRNAPVVIIAALSFFPVSGAALAIEFGLPAECSVGKDCFLQQYPDMDAGPAAVDPFCGPATYDGHEGIDLRVLSMSDVERGVRVVAMADGKVSRLRDGEPDRLISTEADRAAVAAKECGNGLLIDHGGGFETQYCHMRQGSLVVKPGDMVKRGQTLGDVGASGLAQFPHVHVTVRRNGKDIDPVTGRDLSAGCLAPIETAQPLFSPEIAAALGKGDPQLIAFGLAGGPVDHAALSVSGPPPAADAASPAIVAWGWFVNLHKGDRIVVKLTGPDGGEIATNRSDRMDRTKASYSAFSGKKGSPTPGTYGVTAGVERDGKVLFEESGSFTIK